MTIPPTSLATAIHGLSHAKPTHPHAPAGQVRRFGEQLIAAAGQPGQAAPATKSTEDGPGGLLSADLLRMVQAIG